MCVCERVQYCCFNLSCVSVNESVSFSFSRNGKGQFQRIIFLFASSPHDFRMCILIKTSNTNTHRYIVLSYFQCNAFVCVTSRALLLVS